MAPQCSPDSRSQFKPDYWQVLAGITTTIKRSTVVNVLSKHLQYHGNINLQYHGNINSITYLLTYTIKLYAKIRLFRKLTIYVAHKSHMNHGKLLRGVLKKIRGQMLPFNSAKLAHNDAQRILYRECNFTDIVSTYDKSMVVMVTPPRNTRPKI